MVARRRADDGGQKIVVTATAATAEGGRWQPLLLHSKGEEGRA